MTTQIDNPLQLPLLDLLNNDSSMKRDARIHHRVEKTLSEIRRLQEELNEALYTAKAGERPTIHSPANAAAILAPFMEHLAQEELWQLVLNTRNRVLKVCRLYRGSLNQSQVRIAEVFRHAIVENAASIIIAHNHPSGDPSPSPEDVAITKAIVEAGRLLDVDVLDHLIISNDGRTRFISLKERQLGFS